MKQIEICGKKYNIDCNALTYVKYKSFFKTGILKDLHFIQNYLIKQAVITKQADKTDTTESEKLNQISNILIDDTDEFIAIVTRIAWILIYTADNKIEEYEKWLNSIIKLKIDDDWIVEVTEFAVDCFC